MDKIFLNDLKIDAIIGIYDWERDRDVSLGEPLVSRCNLSGLFMNVWTKAYVTDAST